MPRSAKFVRETVEYLFQRIADVSPHHVEVEHWYEDGSARVVVAVSSERDAGIDFFRATLALAVSPNEGLYVIQSLDERYGRFGPPVVMSGIPSAVLAVITR